MIDKIRILCLNVCLICSLIACSNTDSEHAENALARVNEKYLYLEDISSLIQNSDTYEDSMLIIRNYTENWIKEQLVLNKAKINLTEEQQNFDKQLENYKNSLLIYSFEEKLIEQKLDTSISETDIEIYYVYNQENFELKENIVKSIFVKVPLNAPNLEKVNKWVTSSKMNDNDLLNEYCVQFAEKCSFDTSNWISFDKLNEQLPQPIGNPLQFLQSQSSFQDQDSLFKYFLFIKDYRIRSSLSPKGFVREQIKAIILNQRRINLIKEIKKEIFEEGTAKQRYEVYLPLEE